jgi:phosphatidylglycerol:prolipoprotein diacylglycerol transferase
MFPEIFRIGSFPINTYGVLLALSFLVALIVAARLGHRDGLPRERVYDLGLWMLLAGLVGSKVLMFLTEPEYRLHPGNLLSLDFLRSGGVWYGGFLGGIAAGYLLMRRFKLPFWKTADAFAPGVALGQVFGRLGCFAAGCCWGKPTTLPWGVHFSQLGNEVTGVPIVDSAGKALHLHPTQLYESFSVLILFVFLIWFHKRKRFSGQVLLFYGLIYSTIRFTIEFWRDDPRGDVLGLTSATGLSTSQIISLIVGISSLIVLIVRWRRANAAGVTASGKPADGAAGA